MKLLKQMSLKTKMTGIMVLVLVVLGISTYFSVQELIHNYKEDITGTFATSSKTLSNKIGAQFYERYGDVQAFAINSSIKNLDLKRLPSILNEYVQLYGIYDVILVVDKYGRYLASNTIDTQKKPIDALKLSSMNYNSEPWFKSALAEQYTEDKDKGFSGTYFEPAVIDPIIKLSSNEERLGSSFSTALKNEKGEIIGVITNRANSKWFEHELIETFKTTAQANLGNPQYFITTREGVIITSFQPTSSKADNIAHDYTNYNLKYTLASEDYPAFTSVKSEAKYSGQSFTDEYLNKKYGELFTTGFSKVSGGKWIDQIGWNVIVQSSSTDTFKGFNHHVHKLYLVLSVVIILSLFTSIWFGRSFSKELIRLSEGLSINSDLVAGAADKVSNQAAQLSSSATEQAAAIQETVAAVDQITAMVEKSADSARKSRDVSSQSRDAANKGKTRVDQMLNAVEEINTSNTQIAEQMQLSNQQLNEIIRLINDIENKTKVINEIVFQTKLLSFNASVEAARAGEYGKGFAVVAEEVGNLATMSGTASKEISQLLDNSVKKVEGIIADTKSRVDRIIVNSSEKVKVGFETAKACEEALDEILSGVSSVDQLVAEIVVASEEQSTGIREISKAVGQMDQVTQQNSAVAQSQSTQSFELSSQSSELNSLIQTLKIVVAGSQHSNYKGKQQAPPAERLYKAAKTAKTKVTQSFKGTPKTSTQKNVYSLKRAEKIEKPESTESAKLASGSDYVPSSDDPGFSE